CCHHSHLPHQWRAWEKVALVYPALVESIKFDASPPLPSLSLPPKMEAHPYKPVFELNFFQAALLPSPSMVLSLLFVHLFECELPVVKFWAVITGNPTTPYYHTGLAYLSISLFLITD
ncbi:hypothetical protein PAXRUDRAFT_808080, partial [Paxillus rubicundulus Ve08.2h10]